MFAAFIILVLLVIIFFPIIISALFRDDTTSSAGSSTVNKRSISSDKMNEALELVRRDLVTRENVHCPFYPLPKILGALMEYCNSVNSGKGIPDKIGTIFWCNYQEDYTIDYKTLEAIKPGAQLEKALNDSKFNPEAVYSAIGKVSKSEAKDLDYYYHEFIIPMIYTYARFAESMDNNREFRNVIDRADNICFK